MPTSLLRILAILIIMLMQQATADEETLLREIPDVLSLDPFEAAKGLPAQLEGQILWKNTTDGSFFLHHNQQGIYINCYQLDIPGERVIGDRVQVSGITFEGEYSNSVVPSEIKNLGTAPLPASRLFQVTEIWSTQNDCDWVHFTGRITSISIRERGIREKLILLGVNFEDHPLRVELPWSTLNEEKLRELQFLPVEFTAISGTKYNKNRQIVGRVMHATSFSAVAPLHTQPTPQHLKTKHTHELSRVYDDFSKRCRTHGVVTHFDENHLYLRGKRSCLKAFTRSIPNISIGDHVELDGFVQPEEISPIFLAREVRVTKSLADPKPIKIVSQTILPTHSFRILDSRFHNELIQLDAQVIAVNKLVSATGSTTGHFVLCRYLDHIFEIDLSSTPSIPKSWKTGATLRVTGICILELTDEISERLYADQFRILARSASDIKLLKAAPWWIKEKLYPLIGIALACVVFFILWVISLRRTVARQLETIASQVEKESVLNERQRIARDLHDTLEQGLAALKMQLKLIQRKVTKGLPNELYTVQAAEEMLAACSRESRGAIEDMRGGPWETMNLPDAIEQVLGQRIRNSGLKFQLDSPEGIPRLSPFAEQQIMRLLSEAVANATQHASPETITIRLRNEDDTLTFDVADDGTGFDQEIAKQSGRFGLLGMHERANRLNTTLSIESKLGDGTRIHFAVTINDFLLKKSQ